MAQPPHPCRVRRALFSTLSLFEKGQSGGHLPTYGAIRGGHWLFGPDKCYDCRMSSPDREIAQRELRNNVGRVLREVSAGARLRITVRGRPVADLLPIGEGSRF